MLGTFGDTVSPYAVDRLILAKDQRVIIALMNTRIIIAKTHFLPDIGYIHCFEGKCCQDNGIPGIRYGFPIVVYKTDGGLKIISQELEWDKMLVVGYTDYNDLLTKNEILKLQGSDIFKKDILVTCTEAKYQKKTFDILGDSQWKGFTNKEEYANHMKTFVDLAEVTFGRTVNEIEYNKLVETMKEGPVVDRPMAGYRNPPPTQAAKALPETTKTAVETPKQTTTLPPPVKQEESKVPEVIVDDFNDMF